MRKPTYLQLSTSPITAHISGTFPLQCRFPRWILRHPGLDHGGKIPLVDTQQEIARQLLRSGMQRNSDVTRGFGKLQTRSHLDEPFEPYMTWSNRSHRPFHV